MPTDRSAGLLEQCQAVDLATGAPASFRMTDYTHLRVDTTADGIRTITLDRPDRLNAVNGALAASFVAAMDDAARDDAVRVVVITGAGRAFCAGLDLSAPPELPIGTRTERLDPYAWVGRWVQSVLACEKPVVAAVNGPAAGAGFGLALACDVRIVAASAKLTAGYVRRGLSPDAGVSYFLPRHVGLARAADILLTGRDVDAAEAERIGLAARVVPDGEIAAEAAAYAARLAAGAPVAHALTKRLLAETFDRPLDAALREELVHIKYCFTTADVAEAMTAFREKRAPQFRGR
jgi:2-(1,2-epoxy-1,2-dihydrophenyl)acetyl-CoA isomerase